ncbi:tRNA (adenosine(37)-N6)-dimethylallyltransferase MiaA [Deltaproteobacteria bacterium]|nr:tRNA (adenosine(37)-N6)-dimethylallyltransferase MiaA [Deltaproteobacteria bacterium]
MTENRPKLIVITGPTASGKSSLAVELALHFGGEIINSDSMQVYRGMDIGTAKPSLRERKGIVHHIIDVVDPDEEFNASIYCGLAGPVIRDIAQRGKVCFLVGGTGLYIKTLLGGLLKCPPVNPGLREALAGESEKYGSPFLHERLKKLDPESAQSIHPNDRTRVIRALEIINLTKQSLSSLVLQHNFKDRPFKALKICLQVDRDRLYKRINERSVSMIKSGLLDETQELLKKGYSSKLRAMKSLGYRHAVEYLRKALNLEETILQLQRDTRRYSKRQLTWFKADPQMVWVEPGDSEFIKMKIEEFI